MNTWSWDKIDETSFPDKTTFYSELNLEDITDKDYDHPQKVWEVFGINNFGEHHGLYAQCNTLLLADVFKNLETHVLKYMDLILLISFLHQD